MTLAIVITTFVLCAIVTLLVALRSRRPHAIQRSVDINAFRVLMDRADENFLRLKLSRNVFFHLKRQRVVPLPFELLLADGTHQASLPMRAQRGNRLNFSVDATVS